MESIKKDIEFIKNGQNKIDVKLDKLLEKTVVNKTVNNHQGKILGFFFTWMLLLSARVSGWDMGWLVKLKFW